MKEAFSMPLQGWDPVRIVSQIVAFQTLHYLILATLVPPLLAIFAETSSLMFEGGPTQVGMLFDWRQIAALPTYDWQQSIPSSVGAKVIDPKILAQWNLDNIWLDHPHPTLSGIADGSVLDHEQILRYKRLRNGTNTPDIDADAEEGTGEKALEHWEWDHTRDASRSWVLITTWFISIPLDILLLVYLVRRPTHMLDHTLTFHFCNLLTVTLYSSFPTSLTWWITMLVHAAGTIVWSEQLAIKREMNRSVGYSLVGSGSDDPARIAASRTTPQVLFDADTASSSSSKPQQQQQRSYRDREEKIELKQF